MNCLPAHCGDGVIDTGEQCDNGAKNSDTAPDACRKSCKVAYCGDGVKDSNEECDNGPSGSATCTPDCKVKATLHSAAPASTNYTWGIIAVILLVLVIIAGITVRTAHTMMKR